MTLSEILQKYPGRKYRNPEMRLERYVYMDSEGYLRHEDSLFTEISNVLWLTRDDWELVPEIERYEFEGVRKGGLVGGGEAFLYYIEGDYGNPIIKEIPDGGPPWKVTFERSK